MLMGMQGRRGAQLITEGVNAVDHHRRVCGCLLFRFDLKACNTTVYHCRQQLMSKLQGEHCLVSANPPASDYSVSTIL